MHARSFSLCRAAAVLLCALAFAARGAEPATERFKQTRRELHWWQRQRPAKPTPAAQLEHANRL